VDRYDAATDAIQDYAPFRRAFYVVECSDGSSAEITDDEYDAGADDYHARIAHRDAVGVWG
jgi:hypothetical protein